MGRIKTRLIKRITKQFVAKNKETIKTDFASNKIMVGQQVQGASVKLRNVIAGYATRLARKAKD